MTEENRPTSLSADAHRAQLRRAVIASTVGTTIEWYDFLLYGTVTGLVFGKVFFPTPRCVGVLKAFGRVLHRIPRAADRRRDLRPLRRPHRPQGDADRDAVDDRHRDRGVGLVPGYEVSASGAPFSSRCCA